jgi:tetratricopeptide (TPR) repeat protein
MIVERHYDDEALISIAQAAEAAHGVRDPHLVTCSTCADALESYRAISDVLSDESVWQVQELRTEPSAASISRLRSFAQRQQDESVSATEVVDALLASPSGSWLHTVRFDSRYRTAGVARELLSRSEAAIHTMPSDAVSIAKAAIRVAEYLDEGMYESGVVARARGAAARQCAFALFYVGEPVEALEFVDLAQREFERCAVADYDLARLDIVRAVVYRALERHNEAAPLTQNAARVFEAYSDEKRLASACIAEAYLLLHTNQHREALTILRRVESRLGFAADPTTRAIVQTNIGICLAQIGNVADALTAFETAAALEMELGDRSGAIRTRLNVAMLLREQGHVAEARRRLVALSAEVRSLGMADLAVCADLELADLLIVERSFDDAERLCRNAIAYFERSGSVHGEGALMALTYLREAAEEKRLSRETVRHVKRYIERIEAEPQLLFAPLPQSVR